MDITTQCKQNQGAGGESAKGKTYTREAGRGSTSTALVHMSDQWLTNIDDKKLVGAVLLDFTAAFDVIDHSILLAKLKCYGVLPLALTWIKSYLSGRSQRVSVNICKW